MTWLWWACGVAQAQPVVAGAEAGSGPTSPPRPGALGYALVELPAGRFWRGSPETEDGRDLDETRHEVQLTRGFLLGRTEVTEGLWASVTGRPARAAPDLPAVEVSWCDAVWFANALSAAEGLAPAYALPPAFGPDLSYQDCNTLAPQVGVRWDAPGYRLPTEAEWEYAARARDAHTRFAGTDLDRERCAVANVESCGPSPRPVAGLRANAWGLYDLSGNVWEWVWDGYVRYPTGGVTVDPRPSEGADRVCRGGCAGAPAHRARVAARGGAKAGARYGAQGFRLARSTPGPADPGSSGAGGR